MLETNEEKEKRELRELEGKNIAHYQTLLSAWIDTRMEQDKTIIAISAAALGLLVTIITAFGINGFLQYFFAIMSVAGFIVAICSALHIYQLNARHLEENLRVQSTENTSKLLKKLDRLTIFSFYAGIICAVLMAVSISFQKTGGLAMSEKKQDVSKKVGDIKESINGISKLSPKELAIGKSLSGIENLSPQNLKPAAPAASQDSSKTSGKQENSGNNDKK